MHKIHRDIITLVIRNLQRNIVHIETVTGNGFVNQVFIVNTDQDKVVFRINNDRGFDEFVKEKWCIEKTKAKEIQGPKVITLGEIDGHSYMVQSFLEGTVGTYITHNLPVWEQIGKYAKLIHSIPVSGLGLHSAELVDRIANTSQQKWEKYVQYNIENLVPGDDLIKLDAITASQSEEIKSLFQELIVKQFEFGLNHGDLSLKNVIVSTEGTVNLFDWGSAEAQVVPHHDIGEILLSSLQEDSLEFQKFLKGYNLTNTAFETIREDIYSLMLLRAIDKLRWAIDKNPTDVPSFIKIVKKVYELKFHKKQTI